MIDEFLHEFTLAHLLFEVSSILFFEGLLLGLLLPLLLRRLRKEHLTIDAEHGVDHDQPAVPCHHAPDARKCWVFKNCNGMPAEAIIAVQAALDNDYYARLAAMNYERGTDHDFAS